MNLPGTTVVAPDTEDLFDRLGSALMAASMDAVSERGVFHLALSGGGDARAVLFPPRHRPEVPADPLAEDARLDR